MILRCYNSLATRLSQSCRSAKEHPSVQTAADQLAQHGQTQMEAEKQKLAEYMSNINIAAQPQSLDCQLWKEDIELLQPFCRQRKEIYGSRHTLDAFNHFQLLPAYSHDFDNQQSALFYLFHMTDLEPRSVNTMGVVPTKLHWLPISAMQCDLATLDLPLRWNVINWNWCAVVCLINGANCHHACG